VNREPTPAFVFARVFAADGVAVLFLSRRGRQRDGSLVSGLLAEQRARRRRLDRKELPGAEEHLELPPVRRNRSGEPLRAVWLGSRHLPFTICQPIVRRYLFNGGPCGAVDRRA
jgi:hypothetical protein